MWRRTILHKHPGLQALAALILLSGCGTNPPMPGEPAALTAYQTLTPSPSMTPAMGSLPGETVMPSPTPFTYIIQAGDTMGALAQKFGVSLDALVAANPGISPNAMPIGATLLIPTDRNNPTGESTPTPVPFTITQSQCYPTLDNGMWCFALAQNDSSEALENVSAQIILVSPDGEFIGALTAIPPLNIIPPQTAIPLVAFFPAPVPGEARARVQILSAMRLAPGSNRYLEASVVNPVIEIAPGGRSANVSGQASLPADSPPAQSVWVVAVAYDGAGRVVGFRRWEGSGLQAGGSLPFAISVASLGMPITRVELHVEARP